MYLHYIQIHILIHSYWLWLPCKNAVGCVKLGRNCRISSKTIDNYRIGWEKAVINSVIDCFLLDLSIFFIPIYVLLLLTCSFACTLCVRASSQLEINTLNTIHLVCDEHKKITCWSNKLLNSFAILWYRFYFQQHISNRQSTHKHPYMRLIASVCRVFVVVDFAVVVVVVGVCALPKFIRIE